MPRPSRVPGKAFRKIQPTGAFCEEVIFFWPLLVFLAWEWALLVISTWMGHRSVGGLLYPQFQRDLSLKVLLWGSMRPSDADNETHFIYLFSPGKKKNVCSVTILWSWKSNVPACIAEWWRGGDAPQIYQKKRKKVNKVLLKIFSIYYLDVNKGHR